MYKIADKWKGFMFKYAWTKLNLDSVYSKEEWNNAGFKDSVLEKVS